MFTKWSFKNKAAVTLLVVMALVVGVLSYTKLPMELMPEADNPQITVTSMGQGFDSRSMEAQVTNPLEAALAAVKGKTEIFSTTGDGFSRIDINMDPNADMKEAKAEVQEIVNQARLPEQVVSYVLQLNTSMIPVSYVAVSFKEGLTDKEIEDQQKMITNELQKIDGVSNVAMYGKSAPTVNVKVDPAKLAQAGVPMTNLMSLLQGRNMSAAIAEKNIDGSTGNVKVLSSIDSLDTLKKIPVAPGVALSDVATVELKKAQESTNRVNGKDSLFAIINKEASANAVQIGKDTEKAVERLNEETDKAELSIFFSTSEIVVSSVNSMMQEVLMGALFATIVILLFLRNIRATLITIISIPLSLGITLYLLDVSGVTLNIITLGGVAVAVGRLVDDSIVVIENIYRRLQHEKFSVDMIISATKEVASAITSSTITTVAVFLPMGLLRGGLQAFLLPFALTVTYSLLASLLVALTVVPLLSSRLLRNTRMKEHAPSKRFGSFLNWNLRYKIAPLGVATLLLFGSIATYVNLPKGAIDNSDATMINITLQYPSDTQVSKVVEEGIRLEKFLMDQPEPKTIQLSNGNSADAAKWGEVTSPTLATLSVIMKEGQDAETFMENVRAQKDKYPGATLTVSPSSMMGSSSTNITVDIVGENPDDLTKVAQEAVEKIKTVEGVEKVTSNQEETKPVFSIKVDPTLANAQEIAMQLQGMMNPIPIGSITLDKKESPVILEPMINPTKMSELTGLTVMTSSNPAPVPVTQIAKVEKNNEPSTLYHKEGKPYVRITASVDAEKLSAIDADIKEVTKDITLPDQVELLVGGAAAEQAGDFSDLYMTMFISIGLVFLILVVTFKSFRAPLAILFALPLAAIGAVLGLIISGVNPDFTAAFGALMLIGVVVTNAIVLIDRVKQNEEHMTIREALIEAASTRMRPILMTAVATICAMMPLIFGKTEMGSIVSQSLAVVVIGGLAVATLLTLVIVPVMYELLHFRKSAKQRKAQRNAEVAA